MGFSREFYEIRPEDARMWSALGDCYGQLDDTQHMAECHQRSTELEGSSKQSVMIRLARTFERQSLKSMAAKYYRAALEEPDFQGVSAFCYFMPSISLPHLLLVSCVYHFSLPMIKRRTSKTVWKHACIWHATIFPSMIWMMRSG